MIECKLICKVNNSCSRTLNSFLNKKYKLNSEFKCLELYRECQCISEFHAVHFCHPRRDSRQQSSSELNLFSVLFCLTHYFSQDPRIQLPLWVQSENALIKLLGCGLSKQLVSSTILYRWAVLLALFPFFFRGKIVVFYKRQVTTSVLPQSAV